MHHVIRALIVSPLVGFCVAAAAAEIEVDGPRLRVLGPLDGSGLKAFTDHLAEGQVHTVVFEDSRGGSADVAEDYARAIHGANVNTELRGQCSAACAYAFLAGKERRFGRGAQVNSLLIPVGARPTAGDLAALGARPELQKTSSEVHDAPAGAASGAHVVPIAVKEAWRPDLGVLFTSKPTLFGRVYNGYYCDGTQGRDTSRCELLSDADPYRLGVLTQ